MKVTTKSKDKNGMAKDDNFAKGEFANRLLALTNIFGTLEKGDLAEWDLSDPKKPRLKVKSTHKPGNYSFARGFPMLVLGTAFGKIYDCFGWLSGAVKASDDGRKRGTVWEEAPWCDLKPIGQKLGFPCAVAEMPPTIVISKTRFEGTWNGNNLIDTYCHSQDKGDMNEDIWPPFSKLLNLQFQINFPYKRMPEAHAYGWSGAVPFLDKTISGINYRIGHKLEKLGGNLFDFLSFCQWDGKEYVATSEVDISECWKWVLANWDSEIVPAAKKAGIQFQPRLTQDRLRKSYCDGIHVGSEILGECDGEVIWEDFDIRIGKVHDMPHHDSTEKPDDKPEEASQAIQLPEKAPEDRSKKKSTKAKKEKKAKDNGNSSAGGHGSSNSVVKVRVGKKAKIKQFKHGEFDTDIRPKPPKVSVINTWPCLEISGLEAGACILPVTDNDGVLHEIEVFID